MPSYKLEQVGSTRPANSELPDHIARLRQIKDGLLPAPGYIAHLPKGAGQTQINNLIARRHPVRIEIGAQLVIDVGPYHILVRGKADQLLRRRIRKLITKDHIIHFLIGSYYKFFRLPVNPAHDLGKTTGRYQQSAQQLQVSCSLR